MINMKLLKGQTLLALMVSLALSAFLLMLILTFYSRTQQQNRTLMNRLQLQADLHKIVQLMAKDVRRSGFRARQEKVTENNLALFELAGEHQSVHIANGDCLLFFYDLNGDGCIGTQKSGVCLQGANNATKDIERELFGYRFNAQQQMVETHSTYDNAMNDGCGQEQCRSYLSDQICTSRGGWTDLLDEKEYIISQVNFAWISPHGLEIRLAGSLKSAPEQTYTVSAVVPVINEVMP